MEGVQQGERVLLMRSLDSAVLAAEGVALTAPAEEGATKPQHLLLLLHLMGSCDRRSAIP